MTTTTISKDAAWKPTRKCARIPAPTPYLQEALSIATFEPGTYDVVASFAPPAEYNALRD